MCVLQSPPAVPRACRTLRAVAACGPRGLKAAALTRSLGAHRVTLLDPLRRAGLVRGNSGAGNGFHLTRPAADINLLDVVEAGGWRLRLELPKIPVKGGDDLHRGLQAACDDVVTVPGAGWIQSLNVGATAAILMHELLPE